MNDLVLEGFINNFAEAKGLNHLDSNDLFEAFAASSILRKYHQYDVADIEDSILVGGSGDGGIDAIAIMVNGRPARTEDDVRFFMDVLRRLDVEFVFIQAKTSPSFNAADIGNFAFGIEQFFSAVVGEAPSIQFNAEVQQLIDLTKYIYGQGIKIKENPKCYAYYVTSGTWTSAPEPASRFTDCVKRLKQLNIFSDTEATPVDSELLKVTYRELERGVMQDVEISKTAVFPIIQGVDDAYIGLLRGDEFIKMVSTSDGELNRELFYDNVRDFQGYNPVNSEIEHTLTDSTLRSNFPLLNNGVTIVASELNRKGDIFTILDFQIVNGCQTTHMLFQNRHNIDESVFIPVKLVATRDRQVITEVIKATNRQTAVLPEALESLTPFHKELEDFYAINESNRPQSERIYYERRSKQYAMDNIDQRNVVTLTGQIKSFIAMFLNEPHSHPRYYGELLRSYEGRLFANDHKPDPYYACGVALLTIEKWLNSQPSERDLRAYKHQMLMLLRSSIGGKDIPRLNSNAISVYCLKIVDALRDPVRTQVECKQAANVLRQALDRFGRRSGERNPPHRLRAFTERLIEDVYVGKVSHNNQRPRSVLPGSQERGYIKWFDVWKGYGFIERVSGGDIFVHESQVDAVPWHLRIPNMAVRFRIVDNPRSRGMHMASEVELENT